MSTTVIIMLIYRRHEPIYRINLLGSQWRSNVFAVMYEHDPLCVLNKRQDDG
jgi:hypothetical protein